MVGPRFRPLEGDSIDFDQFMESYKDVLDWLAELYVNTLNVFPCLIAINESVA
jgi:formate C-acetyltransferase